MRLNEITSLNRKRKKLIDSLYARYAAKPDRKLRQELISAIDDLYPTSYAGMDASLEEYRNILQNELIEAIMKLPKLNGTQYHNSKNILSRC